MTTPQATNSVRASLALDPNYERERELLAMVNAVDEEVAGRRARGKMLRSFIRAGWAAQNASAATATATARTTGGEGTDGPDA